MPRYLMPLAALFTGVALLLLGNGLLNTLVTLAGEHRGFSTALLGALSSGYFIGFFIGIWIVVPLIRRVGHIRAFAFCAALAAAASLIHTLSAHPLLWFFLRVLYGIALVSLYAIIESWLNAAAPAEQRSKVFSIYMVISLGAVAFAQQLLRLDSPAAFTLFVLAAVMLCLGLLPVTLTRLAQPNNLELPSFKFDVLLKGSPVAAATSGFSGLVLGAFWGLAPVFAARSGLDAGGIAGMMSAAIVGGIVGQIPLGYFSDSHDRRLVLAVMMVVAVVVSVLMLFFTSASWLYLFMAAWGAMTFALYPIAIALMVDHLEPDDVLSGSSGLLMLYGVGAAIGPLIAGLWMDWQGVSALPTYFAVMLAILLGILLFSIQQTPDEEIDHPGHFSPMLRTTPQGLEMMPDAPEDFSEFNTAFGEDESVLPVEDDLPEAR
ncbi:MAG: MFS transporter [Natronospirillum sp.]